MNPKVLSYFEFTAIMVPGSVAIIGTVFVTPKLLNHFATNQINLAEIIIFLFLAYAIGHIFQTASVLIEKIWKLFGAVPPDIVKFSSINKIVSDYQKTQFIDVLILKNIIKKVEDVTKINESQMSSIIRKSYINIKNDQKNRRADIFKGNYTLYRSLFTIFTYLLVLYLIQATPVNYVIILVFLGLGILSLYRMRQYGKFYVREIILESI